MFDRRFDHCQNCTSGYCAIKFVRKGFAEWFNNFVMVIAMRMHVLAMWMFAITECFFIFHF